MRVEYLDHSGSDLLVVNAARCSFGKESDWHEEMFETDAEAVEYAEKVGGTVDYKYVYSDRWFGGFPVTHLADKDKKLINFLAREKHMLPFRHPTVTLRCRAPLFVVRQLGKHQAGMSWSEESRRYITTEPEFYWPDKWRKRADNVKQGSSDEAMEHVSFRLDSTNGDRVSPENLVTMLYEWYDKAIEAGLAPEQARMILPQNMMVTWVWTGTLLAWNHMIKERTAPTTQRETQEFARMVEQIMNDLYPVSMQALVEHD